MCLPVQHRDEIQRRLSLLLGQARFFNNYPPLNNILWPLGSGNAMNMRAVLVFGTLQTAFVCVCVCVCVCVWRGGEGWHLLDALTPSQQSQGVA